MALRRISSSVKTSRAAGFVSRVAGATTKRRPSKSPLPNGPFGALTFHGSSAPLFERFGADRPAMSFKGACSRKAFTNEYERFILDESVFLFQNPMAAFFGESAGISWVRRLLPFRANNLPFPNMIILGAH